MLNTEFTQLSQVFDDNKLVFDLEITKLTAAELHEYLESEENDSVCNYLAKQHPRFLAQALWAGVMTSADNNDYFTAKVRAAIPEGFNPQHVLK